MGYNCALIFIFFTLQFPKAGEFAIPSSALPRLSFRPLTSSCVSLLPQDASDETLSKPGGGTGSLPMLAMLRGFDGRRWEREKVSGGQSGDSPLMLD